MVYRVASPPAQVGLSAETIKQLTDRRQLELEALEHRLTFRIQAMEQGIRQDMPPEPIRRRLRAIELKIQSMDPTWSPPTTDYSDF